MSDPFMMRLLIENILTIVAGTALLGAVALGPIGRALARRIEGRHAAGGDLGELRERLEELEGQVTRLHELEERLDFAERMLAKGREPARLERP